MFWRCLDCIVLVEVIVWLSLGSAATTGKVVVPGHFYFSRFIISDVLKVVGLNLDVFWIENGKCRKR